MRFKWAPLIILGMGTVLTLGVAKQRSIPLVRPLAEIVPEEIDGYVARDLLISENEAQVAGFSNYLLRIYELESTAQDGSEPTPQDSATGFPTTDEAERGPEETAEPDRGTPPPWLTLYVGYYESQAQGKTIHSPKNCLPGAGWEALSNRGEILQLDDRTVTVNRYVLQNEGERALVLYWYQGRGRIAYDEYVVKLNLLRDSALKRRSDEALVRIVVPIGEDGEDAAAALALRAARVVAPRLELALPGA